VQRVGDRLLLAASDLTDYLECPHLTFLNREVATGRLELEETRTDAGELVARKGIEHERAHLDRLGAEGREVVEIATGFGSGPLGPGDGAEAGPDGQRAGAAPSLEDLVEGAGRTLDAMRAGADAIYQAVLFDGDRWRGYADFLERVERPSALGAWSYEVADTKLARSVRPYFLIQLCLYSELLEAGQGARPEEVHLVLGSGERESFRLAGIDAYYRRVKAHFESLLAAEGALDSTYPEPVEHCSLCRWSDHCDARRVADDHLGLVARIRRSQRVRLGERGITTMTALARAPDADRPVRIQRETFATLRAQAALQVAARMTGELGLELLDPEPGHGFARLPPPSSGDLFFDMEGDPFFGEHGLEYLFGVAWIEDGEPRFRPFWALNPAEERRAFESFVDFARERLRLDPGAHIYHYAAYEPTALKRLMGQHGTRENEVDDLLRSQRLVDLYAVVRQAVRISQPSYSIKKVEAFYLDGQRETSVTDGADSIVEFERYLESGDRGVLEAIERYNEDDCVSTWRLREWLLSLRKEAIAEASVDIPFKEPPSRDEVEVEIRPEIAALRARLLAEAEEGSPAWLLVQLLDYHWREAKPAYWEWYRRLEADAEELTERDSEALGGLRDAGVPPEPLPPPRRSLVHTLIFPTQDHQVGPGTWVDPATERDVTVESVDDAAGRLRICRAANRSHEPLPAALIPGRPISTSTQQGALRRFAEDVAARGLRAGGRYGALPDLLCIEPPRLADRPAGAPLQAGRFDLEEAKRVVEALDGGHLFVQGPPGSGKTYTGAHLILHLVGRGARVGVTARSHKAIHNLLHELERFVPPGSGLRGVKKTTDDPDSSFASQLPDPCFVDSDSIDECADPGWDVVAGTAWLFADERVDGALDYLFVDEAGQLALADALAVGTAARNVVLLGDPLQLAQVSRAIHPPRAGASVVEHLLGVDATIPPERGLFIDTTRRMHPDVCRFVSEVVYAGRLASVEDCARQRVEAPGMLSGTGVRFLPMVHQGNTRSSREEAEVIADRVRELVRGMWTDAEGATRPLGEEDVMVVAPFNAQVRCLREALPHGVQVGTVDKFQGQEAPVVFFSMATSSGEEIPRNFDFLFSRERLNVAVSRARGLAVLVCTEDLLRAPCRTPEQMELVNALCRLVEMATAAEP
jgi:predicted RecB family nuclease